MHKFLDNFHQGGKHSAQIAIHQAELRREEKFIDQTSLNISSLQTDYLNIDSSSVLGEIVREQTLFIQSAPFVEVLITLQKCFSKVLDRKRKKLVRLVIRTTDKRNRHLENVFDLDLKIT